MTIIAAVITAVAVIIAPFITAPWWHDVLTRSQRLVIAGAVVDQDTNRGIGQAAISLAGRTDTYVTEDNGNFRIELNGQSAENQRVRIHVTKDGYQPADEGVTPTAENLIIQLKKL